MPLNAMDLAGTIAITPSMGNGGTPEGPRGVHTREVIPWDVSPYC